MVPKPRVAKMTRAPNQGVYTISERRSSRCGLRSLLDVLHSGVHRHCCGLRSLLDVLHWSLIFTITSKLLRLAVPSRCATLGGRSCSLSGSAAACGPFSMCYTSLDQQEKPDGSCGLRSLLDVLHSPPVVQTLRGCGLRSLLDVLHSSP